jgi:formylglycine-generating enzyme required for sulfatase activity
MGNRRDLVGSEKADSALAFRERPYGSVNSFSSFDDSEAGVPANAPRRLIRGGSFLCSQEYCQSFRPSARRGADPYSPMSHVGFRLVKELSLIIPGQSG